jgi:hypothetical protein
MSKLTHESLRQMISEEISKLEASKSEPKSVKVTAKQLRGIILQEVRSMNEKEEIEMDTLNIVSEEPPATPEGALVIRRPNDKYVYAVDDEGVWIVSSPKKELKAGDAIKLDPAKHAVAIRKINRSVERGSDEFELMAKHVTNPRLSKKYEDMFATLTDRFDDMSNKNASKEDVLNVFKTAIAASPNFGTSDVDIRDALENVKDSGLGDANIQQIMRSIDVRDLLAAPEVDVQKPDANVKQLPSRPLPKVTR